MTIPETNLIRINIKGQGISMSMIVVMAIAIVVLLVVALFFSGGFRRIGGNLMSFASATTGGDDATHAAVCNTWCSQYVATGGGIDPPDGYCSTEGDPDIKECAGDDTTDCADWCTVLS